MLSKLHGSIDCPRPAQASFRYDYLAVAANCKPNSPSLAIQQTVAAPSGSLPICSHHLSPKRRWTEATMGKIFCRWLGTIFLNSRSNLTTLPAWVRGEDKQNSPWK